MVLDDLHWAQGTFLDLVEHVAELARTAPIVLLCLARPELLDDRPGWGGGRLNATTILLEPLGPAEASELVDHLAGAARLAPGLAQRIAAATEGNPLFAEELLAELADRGVLGSPADEPAELPVPPTIHALLAARLERLPDDERAVLVGAAVEGTAFHAGGARALAPEALADHVERLLTSLVRRDLIRPDRPSLAGEEAFRFRHALIRDAAYRSLPKEARADLHERFAAWLAGGAGARLPEFDEIAGYHLEQACRLRADVGPPDAHAAALAGRAAAHLEAAGRRALGRSDRAAAIGLLERSAALRPDGDPGRARVLADLGAELIVAGRLPEAGTVLGQAIGGGRGGRERRPRRPTRRSRSGSSRCSSGRRAAASRRWRWPTGCCPSSPRPATSTACAGRCGCARTCTGSRPGPATPPPRGSRPPSTRSAPAPSTSARTCSAGWPRRCSSARRRSPRPSAGARRSARR